MENNKIKLHHYLSITWVIISLWGVINVYSASYIQLYVNGSNLYTKGLEQLIIFIAGCVALIIIYRFKRQSYNLLYKSVNVQYYIILICLAIVIIPKFVPGIPSTINARGGANSVIPLPFFDFQPLEYFKVVMILFFAKEMNNPNRDRTFNGYLKFLAKIMLGIVLIFLEPDTGGALITGAVLFGLVILNMEYINKFLKVIIPMIIAAILGLGFLLIYGSASGNYKLARFATWWNPFSAPATTGYDMINALVAYSNGGILGEGYTHSIQKTGFLTSPYTDYIFPVICEEWGLFGAVFSIGLLLAIGFLAIRIGMRATDRFGQLYASGFGWLILVQAMVNIGGVTGVIPLTGVTLPFISSGLNSYIFLTAGLFYVIIIDIETNRKRRIYAEKAKKLFL